MGRPPSTVNDILFACKLFLSLAIDPQAPILCIDKSSICPQLFKKARDKKVSFFQMLSDGFAILNQYKEALLVFFLTTFGLGLFVARMLKLDKFLSGIGLLACFGLGSLLLVVASYLLAILAQFWPFALAPGSFLFVLLAAAVIIHQILTHKISLRFNAYLLAALIALFLLLLVRLSILEHIFVPPYSDSPIHYQAIADILGQGNGLKVKISLANIHKDYYHFGFHTLTAWLVSATGIPALDGMSLLGQVFLVIGPISVFALALVLTGSIPGALLAGLLAAIGWSMPAFAVNWGKFPALLSLAAAPAALAVLQARRKVSLLWAILAVSFLTLGAVLLHTRIIFVLALAIAGFYLAGKAASARQPDLLQTSLRALALGLFLLAFLTSFGAEAYRGWPLWIFLLALTPFGVWVNPRPLFAAFAFLAGIWLLTFLPLLDRPFLEMLLALPLSLWGAAGFSGLLERIGQKQWLKIGAAVAAFSLVLVVFLARGAYLPDPCCNYFTAQDAQAFGWIRENASPRTLFVIAVFADENQRFGTDAGIWIQPLTGTATNMLAYDSDWDDPAALEALCRPGGGQTYLYTGGTAFSFPSAELARQTWLQPVFRAEQVQLYQVTGCNQP